MQLGDAEAVGVQMTIAVALGTSTPTSMTVVATSTSTSPAAKRAHHGVLLVGRQPAVQHLDPQPGQRALGEHRRDVEHRERPAAPVARRRSAGSSTVVVGPSSVPGRRPYRRRTDAGAHHVRLVARGDLLAHPLQARSRKCGFSAAGTTWVAIGERPAGSSVSVETSRSPKTVIATVRGIGVAVMTSTCGGTLRLAAQGVALLDAEAVLLVDDDQAEVVELDAVLDQRVRADDDAGVAGDDVEQRRRRAGGAPASR